MNAPPRKTLTFSLPPELVDQLQAHAVKVDLSVSRIVRQAVREFLARQGAPTDSGGSDV